MRGSRSADTAASTASVRPSSRSWRSEIPPLSRVSSKEVAKVESRHDHRWWPGSNATESRMIAASFSLVACGSGDADGPPGRPSAVGRTPVRAASSGVVQCCTVSARSKVIGAWPGRRASRS